MLQIPPILLLRAMLHKNNITQTNVDVNIYPFWCPLLHLNPKMDLNDAFSEWKYEN